MFVYTILKIMNQLGLDMTINLSNILEVNCSMNQFCQTSLQLMGGKQIQTAAVLELIEKMEVFFREHKNDITPYVVELFQSYFVPKMKSLNDLSQSMIYNKISVLNSFLTAKAVNREVGFDHMLKPEYFVIQEWLKTHEQIAKQHPQLARELLDVCKEQIERFKTLESGLIQASPPGAMELFKNYYQTNAEYMNMIKVFHIQDVLGIDLPLSGLDRYKALDQEPFLDLYAQLNNQLMILLARQAVERMVLRSDLHLSSREIAHRLLFGFEPFLNHVDMNPFVFKGTMQMLLIYAFPDLFKWNSNFTELVTLGKAFGLSLEDIYLKNYDDAYVLAPESTKRSMFSQIGNRRELPEFMLLLRCFQEGIEHPEKIQRYITYISKATIKDDARFAAEVFNYLISVDPEFNLFLNEESCQAVINAVESASYRQTMKKVASAVHLKSETNEMSIAKQFRLIRDNGETLNEQPREKMGLLLDWVQTLNSSPDLRVSIQSEVEPKNDGDEQRISILSKNG